MFDWLKRLFRIFNAEAHDAVDKLEDPVKLTEQGIRELKEKFGEALKGLAEVKALTIRSRKDYEQKKTLASEYEQKAIMLLEKAQAGHLDTNEADRLASQALAKKDQLTQQLTAGLSNLEHYTKMERDMEATVSSLKGEIGKWENELKSLKARSKVSKVSKKFHQDKAGLDTSGTLQMLEKMRDKVANEEAEAKAYSEINTATTSVDDEINKALGGVNSASLSELKSKMAQSSTTDENTKHISAPNANPMSELALLKQKLKDNSK